MNKIIIILLFILYVFPVNAGIKYNIKCGSALAQRAVTEALSQENVLEFKCKNSGDVLKYLDLFNARAGTPYCAAGIYWCLVQAAKALNYPQNKIPFPKSLLANSYFDFAKKNGTKSKYQPQKSDLIVWKRRNSIYGHIEIITKVGEKGWVETIGFNTKKQIKGQTLCGVFKHKRNIFHPLGALNIRGLIGLV